MPPVDECNIVQAAIRKAGFVELNDSAYSPDIAPSDYYLFSNLKKFLHSKNFSRDDDTVDDYLTDLNLELFCKTTQSLRDRGCLWLPREGQYMQ